MSWDRSPLAWQNDEAAYRLTPRTLTLLALLLGACSQQARPPEPVSDDPAPPPSVLEVIDTAFGCVPAAATVEVTEGDAVELSFGCSDTATAESWELVAAPPGATLDGASGVLLWETDLASAGTWNVQVYAVAGGGRERGAGTLYVNDATGVEGNEPVVPSTYTHEFGLPVLHFDEPETLNPRETMPVPIVYAGRTYATDMKERGATSSHYPRRSYRIDFPPDDEFNSVTEDYPKRRRLALTTLFDDNAYFRQKLCYDVWNSLSDTNTDIHSEFVVVYRNGTYWGLYMLSDQINGEWWEDAGYPEDGNLYKAINHEANFFATFDGAEKLTWHDGYEKKEGEADNWDDLDALVQFVVEADDATFDSGIGDRIVTEEIYDWWILALQFSAYDTVGKNAYFYNDPAAALFRFVPWDFNHSLGQTYQTKREPATDDWDYTDSNNLYARLLASEVHGPAIRARMAEHRAGPMHPDVLNARIDGYLAGLDRGAIDRDWARWEAEYRAYDTWETRTDWTQPAEEIAYIRQWIVDRQAWIDVWGP